MCIPSFVEKRFAADAAFWVLSQSKKLIVIKLRVIISHFSDRVKVSFDSGPGILTPSVRGRSCVGLGTWRESWYVKMTRYRGQDETVTIVQCLFITNTGAAYPH